MLTVTNRLLVMARSGSTLRCGIFSRSDELCLEKIETLTETEEITSLSGELGKCLVLYLLSPSEYEQKRIEFASRFRLDTDPDQICWEIERRSVTPFHKSRYNLMRLKGSSDRDALIALSLNEQKQAEIFDYCNSSNLLLHRLMFRPAVLHDAFHRQAAAEHCIVIVVSPGSADLLFYHNQQLVDIKSLAVETSDERTTSAFVDDVGTLAASIFSGVRLSQKLQVVIAGADVDHPLAELLASQLPYRVETRFIDSAMFVKSTGGIQDTPPPDAIDLCIAANAYVETEPCESLPVKNAASP